MIRIECERIINCASEQVFDYIADGRKEPQYNSHVIHAKQISDGPTGSAKILSNAGHVMYVDEPELVGSGIATFPAAATTEERSLRVRGQLSKENERAADGTRQSGNHRNRPRWRNE
jgi:hypothetical protein